MTEILHTISIPKDLTLEKAEEIARQHINKKKLKHKIMKDNYIFKTLPRTKFIKGGFKKVKNNGCVLTYGVLKPEFEHLKGAGFFDTVKSFVRNPIQTVKNILNVDQFSNISKRTLEQYGNNKIVRLQMGKTPLHDLLTGTIDAMTFGNFSKLAKEKGYDSLYHVFLIADLDIGKSIVIEKNAVINIAPISTPFPQNTTYMNVNMNGLQTTLNELIKKTQDLMKGNFFYYDPFENNCQVFLENILKANNLWTPQYNNFFFQDVSNIKKQINPVVPKIMRKITDLGGIVSRILGKGKKNKKQCIEAFYDYIEKNNLGDIDDIENLKEHFLDFINSSGLKYL